MKTYLHMSNVQRTALPPEFGDDDVRFAESLAEHFIQRFTQPGDTVLDPFAGFGTTLRVAEALGRAPFGIELDQRRVDYVRARLQSPDRIIHGDSRRLAEYQLPPIDFSLTSPPYMSRDDPEDPFTAYAMPGQGYAGYLATIRDIYAQVRQVLRPGARAVIEVANLKGPRGVTTLAWDVAAAVAQVLTFEGEIVIMWEPSYGYGYDHSYCLVFSAPEQMLPA